jgi:hypothetical protein
MKWIQLAQDMTERLAVMNMVIKLRVLYKQGPAELPGCQLFKEDSVSWSLLC